MLRVAVLLGLCLLLGSPAVTSGTAAPDVIIVRGDLISGPIVLDDWDENLDLMLGLGEPRPTPPFSLDGRPHLGLSLFWAVGDYLKAGVGPLELLQREFPLPENHEEATFYLGRESEPPILEYHGFREVKSPAAEILAAHGVPLVAEPGSSDAAWTYVVIVAAATGAAAMLVALYKWRSVVRT